MVSASDLQRAVENAIQTTTLSLDASSRADDWYEAYILSLVIIAARREGANVWYEDVNGNPASHFQFRTSPGYIFSRRRSYVHAVIEFTDAPALEAHMSVRYVGKSGVAHESDVSVIKRSTGQLCRTYEAIPHYGSQIFSVECKYYDENRRVQINMAREFLGLIAEIGKEQTYFVANAMANNVPIILEQHTPQYEEGVLPTVRQEERLINAFQKRFDRYRVRSRQVALSPTS